MTWFICYIIGQGMASYYANHVYRDDQLGSGLLDCVLLVFIFPVLIGLWLSDSTDE